MKNSAKNYLTLIETFFFLLCTTFVAAQPLSYLPFENGQEMRCVQGNNGSYSHSGNLRYAYDFDFRHKRNPSSDDAFGIRVLAPFTGTITDVQNGVPDYTNNSSSNPANNGGLGNTVQLSVVGPDGKTYFVRFAHLQNNSIPSTFRIGTTVTQGTLIGKIGQTGYSTSPHLHMHMSTTAYGSSIAFDFVEGPMGSGSTTVSSLERNKFMIDNSGRMSLGFPVVSPSVSRSGTWTSYVWRKYALATNYMGSTTSGAWFQWQFDYKVPTGSNVSLSAYASCPEVSTQDRAARYTYRTTSSSTVATTTHDQRYISEGGAYLGRIILAAGTRRIIIKAARSASNRLCADGIIFYRN